VGSSWKKCHCLFGVMGSACVSWGSASRNQTKAHLLRNDGRWSGHGAVPPRIQNKHKFNKCCVGMATQFSQFPWTPHTLVVWRLASFGAFSSGEIITDLRNARALFLLHVGCQCHAVQRAIPGAHDVLLVGISKGPFHASLKFRVAPRLDQGRPILLFTYFAKDAELICPWAA